MLLVFLIFPPSSKVNIPQQTPAKKIIPDHELLYAASAGDTVKCAYFLGQGAKINARDKAGRTALMRASLRGHNDTVKFLLQSGADVEAEDSVRNRAIMLAASAGKLEVVRTLLRFGAYIHAGHRDNRTPLLLACRGGYSEVAAFLLDNGASLLDGYTSHCGPVVSALKNNHPETARMLLLAGSSVVEYDEKGNSVLQLAIMTGSESLVKYLLENYLLDIEHRNNAGESARYHALQTGNRAIIELLKHYNDKK